MLGSQGCLCLPTYPSKTNNVSCKPTNAKVYNKVQTLYKEDLDSKRSNRTKYMNAQATLAQKRLPRRKQRRNTNHLLETPKGLQKRQSHILWQRLNKTSKFQCSIDGFPNPFSRFKATTRVNHLSGFLNKCHFHLKSWTPHHNQSLQRNPWQSKSLNHQFQKLSSRYGFQKHQNQGVQPSKGKQSCYIKSLYINFHKK